MKEEYDFSQGKRGAIDPIANGRTRVNTVLDNDILEWFRSQVHAAGGGNYQALINNVLREHMQHRQELSEAQEKNKRDLDEVFETLERITKTKARSSRVRGLRSIEVSTKWRKILFFELGGFGFFITSILLLKDFQEISLVFASLASIFFVIFFVLMFSELRQSSKISHKELVENFVLNNFDQENVNLISKKFSISVLQEATKKLEVSLKNFQSRRKTMDTFLPIYITISIAVLIPVFGGESVQKILEEKPLFGIVTGVSGAIALLILIFKFFLAVDEESKTNKYNEWLFILEKAQTTDDSEK